MRVVLAEHHELGDQQLALVGVAQRRVAGAVRGGRWGLWWRASGRCELAGREEGKLQALVECVVDC